MINKIRIIALAGFSFLSLVFSPESIANHSWSKYQWKPPSVPFILNLGDNVNSDWDGHLLNASADWSVSAVLDTTVVAGSTDSASCSPEAGNIQVCNDDYGDNGWLGLAQIYTRGFTIIAGLAKLNDFYYTLPTYDTPAWRRMVVCQEIAHTFGLDHQDEIFGNANLGTCMDYTDDPDGSIRNNGISNEYPNQHDYDQLVAIYAADAGSGDGGGCNPRSPKCSSAAAAGGQSQWGQLVSGHGAIEVFERNLGGGRRVITFVTWTLENVDTHDH